MIGSLICLNRLYGKFSLEITLATSLGHYIDVLNGEANRLVEAANETINFMRVDKVLGIPELSLIFFKFEALVDNQCLSAFHYMSRLKQFVMH